MAAGRGRQLARFVKRGVPRSAHPLHVLFGHSAAGALMQALRFPGRPFDARVIVLDEPFHLGPIAPADPEPRTAWFRTAQLCRGVTAPQVHRFWRHVVAEEMPIVWACTRDAREWCGLMELAWRRRRPFLHVDVGPLRIDGRLPSYCSTGEVSHERIVNARLVERALRVTQAEVDAYAAAWASLARSSDPMRIATRHGVLAVPLSYFDDAILARTPPTDIRAMHVIGDLHGHSRDLTRFAQFDDSFLAQRIDALLDAGLLVSDNIEADLRALRIRRPA